MAAVRAALLATALLYALSSSSSSPFCPESCSCQTASLLNCSLSGLTSVPQLIPGAFSELDFSHNYLSSVKPRQPHQNLRKLWLGNNTISHLSLCVERHVKSWRRFRTGGERGCQGWAPTLQMLSVERNQLERLPKGLGGVPSLRVLWLAFNKISVLQPGELSDLHQLEELHLQHNLITHLHPQMFQDLIQLRVLDLRFNLMTTLHPLMYLNLHNIGAHVALDGNRWKCDCNLRSLRRRMAYDDARGVEVWNVMCASPSKLLGTDLLQLKEEDLQCLSPENSPDLHQDVTVYRGSQILLSCSAEDSVWWTPGVPAPERHKDGGLLITDISETNTGLYVCVSEGQQVVSVFNLQISQIESAAKTRSLPRTRREITPQSREGITQSTLTLAICLSVIITFLVAFILGVATRPYIDLLWKRITTKKGSSASNSVSSVEQRHYENAAFSNSDEAVEGGPYRERRVTFRNEDDIENINVQYYDTVASSDQNSVASEEVFASEEGPNTQESECDQGMQQMNAAERQNGASSETTSMQIHQVEFEHIPDPDELENRSLSSSSDSSLSENVEQMTKICHTTPKSPLLEKETIHKRANSPAAKEVQDPQASIEIPGFSSEPFADWSPHSDRSNSKDELFDFSDSPRSTPARPNSGFAHTLDKQKSGDTFSSSSSDSGAEHTQDILHSKEGRQRSKIKSSAQKQSRHTSSSDESTDQETKLTKTHKLRKKWPSIVLGQKEIKAPSPGFSTSSSSDSEDETKDNTKTQKLGMLERPIIYQEFVTGTYMPDGGWPIIDVQSIPRIKRRLDFVKISSQKSGHNYWLITHGKVERGDLTSNSDSSSSSEREENMPRKIKTPSPRASSSSSSSESDDEVKVQIKPLEQNKEQMSRPQQMKDQSESSSSSSSDSEDGIEQRPGSVKIGQLQEPQPKDYDPHGRWPTVDLLHVPHINRRLDFKVLLSHSSSSSSDNIDRTTSLKKVQKPAFQTSTSPLVKAPSQSSSSSSSSESDDDVKVQIKPLEQNKVQTSRPQQMKDQSESSSSSSSDSEDGIEQRPGSVKIGQLQEPQPRDYVPDGRWPTVDLLHVPNINRRLDFKVR
uniref:Leucine rich repeat containing 66 n=2 Tax=Oryzias melastigma TaxID=30732 RepID=A0A3B3CBX4_ORYME